MVQVFSFLPGELVFGAVPMDRYPSGIRCCHSCTPHVVDAMDVLGDTTWLMLNQGFGNSFINEGLPISIVIHPYFGVTPQSIVRVQVYIIWGLTLPG